MSRNLLVAFVCAVAFMPAQGQGVPPARSIIRQDSTTQNARDLGTVAKKSPEIDDMKAALRDLVVAEETYFAAHQGYTMDHGSLDIFPTKHGQAQTSVTFIGPNSWSGTATEPSLKGKNCVMYVGLLKELPKGAPKTLGGVVAKEEGVPACDEP
jgi:hypothetical protein